MNLFKKSSYSDWLGVLASGLCVAHCAMIPLIFSAKPVFYGMIDRQVHNHGAWASLDYIFLVLGLLAVYYSARHTAHVTLKWILWLAWGVFAFGLLSEPLELSFGKWLMYASSITLVIAHIGNYRYRQQCKNEMQN